MSTSKYRRKLHREEINDESGNIAEKMIRRAGGTVRSRFLISDDVKMLTECAEEFIAGRDDVAVFVGGTGISHSDLTIETIRPMLEKELKGFGEILRRKSYSRVGGAAFLTRATAGVVGGKLVICLPGSPDAVRTGLRLTVNEFASVLGEARS